jgi:DNA repair protein RadA/Sms
MHLVGSAPRAVTIPEPEGLLSPAAMAARKLTFGPRLSTGIPAVDRVLGKHPERDEWGLHVPACIQLGGRKGSGKSTLLLQILAHLATYRKVLYVSAEEPEDKVYLRAMRCGLTLPDRFRFMEHEKGLDRRPHASVFERIEEAVATYSPAVVGVDSLSVLLRAGRMVDSPHDQMDIAHAFYRDAHATRRIYILLNQQTKEGSNSGLEKVGHKIDGSFLLDRVAEPEDTTATEARKRLRRLRSDKNRDGQEEVTELFTITDDQGLVAGTDDANAVEEIHHLPSGERVRVDLLPEVPTPARRRRVG